jgi:hypothetical protein
MPFSKQTVFGIVLSLTAAAGCASAPAVYGERARFSPAFQGYVMAVEDGSDDPAKDDTVLLLRDPVTGDKLRCREDVLSWRELHEDIALDQMRDHRAVIAAVITAPVVLGPVAALQPLGGLAVIEAMYAAESIFDLLRTKNAGELLEAAITLYERKRFPQSSLLIEHALAKDSTFGVSSKALYYLGLSYAEQGKSDRAGVALTAFIDRSAVRDVDGYRKAEAALKTLGIDRKACESTEPVDLHW